MGTLTPLAMTQPPRRPVAVKTPDARIRWIREPWWNPLVACCGLPPAKGPLKRAKRVVRAELSSSAGPWFPFSRAWEARGRFLTGREMRAGLGVETLRYLGLPQWGCDSRDEATDEAHSIQPLTVQTDDSQRELDLAPHLTDRLLRASWDSAGRVRQSGW